MSKNNCVAGFYVELSPAIENLPLSRTELSYLVRAFRYFPRGKALKLLFRLTYGTQSQKAEALNWFKHKQMEGVVISEDYLEKILRFTDEEFSILAKELLFQYQADDSSFLDIKNIQGFPDNCKEEVSLLETSMAEHPVLLFRTVEKCILAHKRDNVVSRCVVLLLSDDPVSQTIGLQTLGFKFEYRVLLRPFAQKIAALLLAMHKSYIKKQKILSSQDNFALPLIELLKQMKAITENVQSDDLDEQYEDPRFDEIIIFEKELMNFIEHFEGSSADFTEYQQKLMHLGNAILALQRAKLESTKVNLELAERNSESTGEKNDGILFAAATNLVIAQKVVDTEKAHNLAVAEYHSAFAIFREFLEEKFETP